MEKDEIKVLVTGGAGFIGSNFIDYMAKKYPKYYFIALDNLSVLESNDNIELLNSFKNVSFIKGDIRDPKFMDELFNKEKFDYVVNFAAEISVDYSIDNPHIFLETNILGLENLMNLCRKYNVKRIHQISTDEVY